MPSESPRDRLLSALVEYAAAHGLADASLRELAAAVGTSHRMLLYHFGSREGVVAAEPVRLDAEIALIDERGGEDGEVFFDVGDVRAKMFTCEMLRHVLGHEVRRDGGADRDDACHAADYCLSLCRGGDHR